MRDDRQGIDCEVNSMNWSKYQLNIFKAVADTTASLIIRAVAGSGKSTTIVEAVKCVPKQQKVVFLAFNKSIADTLKSKVTSANAQCATLHSMGLRAWKRTLGEGAQGLKVDSGKTWDVMKQLMSWDERRKWGATVKMVGLAKQVGLVPDDSQIVSGSFIDARSEEVEGEHHREAGDASESILTRSRDISQKVSLDDLPETTSQLTFRGLVEDNDEQWIALADEFDVDVEEYDIGCCRAVLKESLLRATSVVDYDDMLYLPVVARSPFETYDVVFVDEWQDTNGIQHEMIARMLKKPMGRLIAVGDENQAIYRFRGSRSDCMEIAQERFGCKALPLSISYRCPKSVVQHAQQWVPQIECSETAAAGKVYEYNYHTEECPKNALGFDLRRPEVSNDSNPCPCPHKWLISDFRATDVILCRLTRPLIEVAFKLIRSRIPCRVLGRDIGAGLVKLIEKARLSDYQSVDAFVEWFDAYESKETRKLIANEEFTKAGLLADKCETLRIFTNDSNATTIAGLKDEIQSLFRDTNGNCITLSTIHKAKGLEWPRVFILDADTLMPCQWSNDPVGEKNLAYVAATRAQHELHYIRTKELR